MAGGIGSRFWPFSRTNFPKQFHDILGTGKTLIQQTADRYSTICPPENLYVVTNKEYYQLVKQQLPWMLDEQILLEPAGRNTAPCVAYAAMKISQRNPDANMVVCPADHVILKEETFVRTIADCLDATREQEILLTMGITPSRPDTGYGYIQFRDSEGAVKKVKTFTEKPHLELAIQFLESGEFVWNSGIFIWNSKAILKALETHLPEMHEIFHEGENVYYTQLEQEFIDKAYSQVKNVSVDIGIMEKAPNVYVMLADFGWSDLGTWKSLYDLSEKDANANVVEGNALIYDSQNCIIRGSNDKLIVVEGLDNYIVAESDGVVMICRKDQEQRVKDFVADCKTGKDKRFV